ncbi:MAG: sulfite oxidase-like oxidoreductase [Pseudomonadota bacterium]|nr:sulfite oxidase-like oxidoreductase [Pseudomonadota bacterium]
MLWRPGKAQRSLLTQGRERSADRLPPGQRLVKGWPVLHEGEPPVLDVDTWRFRVWGEVERPQEWTWAELQALPRIETTQDFHCVTTWSRYDNRWGGISVSEILGRALPRASASHVLVHCFDATGYTANLPLADFARAENLFALTHDDAPLSVEHGGPIRLVVHHLYAWKSAKWVAGVEVLPRDVRGYWEERGYHNRADPWLEERYSHQE